MPSLPGYGYSSGPPLDRNFTNEKSAVFLDKLMVGLGFGDGYISQGGDIGSFLTRILVVTSDHCKTGHSMLAPTWQHPHLTPIVNLCIGASPPSDTAIDELSDQERTGFSRAVDFGEYGNAYARMHGTRPATIGLVLSSSPVALLAWSVTQSFAPLYPSDPKPKF